MTTIGCLAIFTNDTLNNQDFWINYQNLLQKYHDLKQDDILTFQKNLINHLDKSLFQFQLIKTNHENIFYSTENNQNFQVYLKEIKENGECYFEISKIRNQFPLWSDQKLHHYKNDLFLKSNDTFIGIAIPIDKLVNL